MALAYRPPNVTASETVTASISPLLATPASVSLIGPAQGFEQRTDQFILSGTSATPLPGLPSGASVSSVLSVKNALDPSQGATDGSGYVVTTDYTVSTVNGTITRVGGGGIPDNTLVNVTYTYVASNYFEPIRLSDFGSVQSRFGPALNASGTAINSYLTFGAQLAFENGVGEVICQPLLKRGTPGDPSTVKTNPSTSDIATVSTWADTLYVLRDFEDINVFIPLIGQSHTGVTDSIELSIFQTFQDHLAWLKNIEQYGIALFGEDSSTSNSVAQKATLRTHAQTLQGRYGGSLNEQLVLLAPSNFTKPLPGTGSPLNIGGQYVAAAIGGAVASRPVSKALTREVLSGISSVVETGRVLQDRNIDAAAGLLVLQNDNGVVQVRHSVTLDNSATARRELSVVRGKHRVIESVRDTINRQIIGKIIADDDAPSTVNSTITKVLESLVVDGDIVQYRGVESRLLSLEPTTLQARFSYRPAFPLNYVDIIFSLDLTNNTITVV